MKKLIGVATLAILYAQSTVINTNSLNSLNSLGSHSIQGKKNNVNGRDNQVLGYDNNVEGDVNYIYGDVNDLNGHSNLVAGFGNKISGSGNLVSGQGNFVVGDDASEQDKRKVKQQLLSLFAQRGISNRISNIASLGPSSQKEQKQEAASYEQGNKHDYEQSSKDQVEHTEYQKDNDKNKQNKYGAYVINNQDNFDYNLADNNEDLLLWDEDQQLDLEPEQQYNEDKDTAQIAQYDYQHTFIPNTDQEVSHQNVKQNTAINNQNRKDKYGNRIIQDQQSQNSQKQLELTKKEDSQSNSLRRQQQEKKDGKKKEEQRKNMQKEEAQKEQAQRKEAQRKEEQKYEAQRKEKQRKEAQRQQVEIIQQQQRETEKKQEQRKKRQKNKEQTSEQTNKNKEKSNKRYKKGPSYSYRSGPQQQSAKSQSDSGNNHKTANDYAAAYLNSDSTDYVVITSVPEQTQSSQGNIRRVPISYFAGNF